jgi:DNA-directed RNA polymerase alpha subunit
MALEKTLRTCDKGHKYYKSSDCPTCPFCEREKKPTTGFLSRLVSPARNALLYNGIKTLKTLSTYSEKEVLKFHGMGPSTIPILREALKEEGLSFKNDG